MKQTPGKIYLAEQRGIAETAKSIRFSTFNFNDFYQEHKQPIGSLYLVNEEILAGSQSLITKVEQDSHIVIIPLAGAVQIYLSEDNFKMVDVGEVLVITAPANQFLCLANPYDHDIIHFLQFALKTDNFLNTTNSQLFQYKFEELENQLAAIIPEGTKGNVSPGFPFSLNLGRFDGRREATYQMQDIKSICFAFVLSGAFEAQGRLLHEKDGLALWDTEELEFEALSNNAILFVIELKQTQ
ncbi:MAG: hypothetical protein M3142_09630 [Bacteroidota bacterium]|nr:hypothetical protein [Bacteroidota bacterium]